MAKAKNTTIVDFCRDWQVYCPPLDILFPPVYQVVQTITRQELAAYAFPGEELEPVTCAIDYSLNPYHKNIIYPGVVEISQIHSILDGGTDSLLVRHHPDEAARRLYWQALYEYGIDLQHLLRGGIIRTEAGVFELIVRPNRPHWPAPLIIYRADVPQRVSDQEEWCLAVLPDQTVVHPFEDLNGMEDDPNPFEEPKE